MSQNKNAIAYVRGPETRGLDLPYEEKFSAFSQAIADAKSKKADIVISAPWIIGDTYEEIIESLSRLAGAGIALHVAQR